MVTEEEIETVHTCIKTAGKKDQLGIDDDEIEQITGLSLFAVIEARQVLHERGLIKEATG